MRGPRDGGGESAAPAARRSFVPHHASSPGGGSVQRTVSGARGEVSPEVVSGSRRLGHGPHQSEGSGDRIQGADRAGKKIGGGAGPSRRAPAPARSARLCPGGQSDRPR